MNVDELDSLVAKAEGVDSCNYHPTTNWIQGGLIIERERIRLEPQIHHIEWVAYIWCDLKQEYITRSGETPLVASMRAYAAKLFID